MTDEQWEAAYWECCRQDMANRIYQECDAEEME